MDAFNFLYINFNYRDNVCFCTLKIVNHPLNSPVATKAASVRALREAMLSQLLGVTLLF